LQFFILLLDKFCFNLGIIFVNNLLAFFTYFWFFLTRNCAACVIGLMVTVPAHKQYGVLLLLLLLLLAVSCYGQCAGHLTRYLLGDCQVFWQCLSSYKHGSLTWPASSSYNGLHHWGIFLLWNRCSVRPGTIGTAARW